MIIDFKKLINFSYVIEEDYPHEIGNYNKINYLKVNDIIQKNIDYNWECIDKNDHYHYWIEEDGGESFISDSIGVEEEGLIKFYCAECDEELYPEYEKHSIPLNSHFNFTMRDEINIKCNDIITIKNIPTSPDLKLMITKTSIECHMRGRFLLYVEARVVEVPDWPTFRD